MGENIGTTITANIAALSANTQARRAALAHLLFNVFGVLWVLAIFYPFVNTACNLVGVDPHSQYIQSGIMKTPEISVLEAQKETRLFADRMRLMFGEVRELYAIADADAFAKKAARIKEMEEMSDRLESEIGGYLAQVGNAHLSDDTKRKVRSLTREVSELESIGDSLFNLSRAMERKLKQKAVFTEELERGIADMFALVEQAMDNMCLVLKGDGDQSVSLELENKIDTLRTVLLNRNTDDVDEGVYSFDTGTIFIDIVRECEKCGDYIINVVEAKMGKRDNVPESGALRINVFQKEVSINGEPVDLTKTEFELLSLLSSNPGRIFSREELLELVWPKDVVVGERVVDVNIRRIRAKLGDLSDHIRTKAGYGYYYE